MNVGRSISAEQRRALRLLAGSPLGCTEAILLAHGLEAELLALLVRDGLATTQPGTMRAGRRQIEVVWVMITDAGQRALGQQMTLLRHRFHEFLNSSHRFDRTKNWALFKDYKVPEDWGGAHPKWVRVFSQGFVRRDK